MYHKSVRSIYLFLLLQGAFLLHGEISIMSRFDGGDWILTIDNQSDSTYSAMIISSDPSFKSEKGQISIPPGNREEVRIHKTEERHQDQLYLRFISDHEDNPGIYGPGRAETSKLPGYYVKEKADLEYYYTPDCGRCRDFLDNTIPALEEKINRSLTLAAFDVTTTEGLNKLMESLARLKSTEKKIPLIIIGDRILAGDREIEEKLEASLLEVNSHRAASVVKKESSEQGKIFGVTLLPVFLAGLLDGINPCAFSTLIFLLSWLGLAGRSKREIFTTGLFFSISVFLTYYAVGLGAFSALRAGETLKWVGWLMKYTMATLLLVLAIINLSDYKKIKAGKTGEVTLQLSRKRKQKIHKVVREKTRKAGLITGSLFLGFSVTLFELGCTGQIYLPTLMYMTRMNGEISSYLLLGLYNMAFIVPLLVVFTMAWKGMTSERLALWFAPRAGLIKLLSALFFVAMAILLIIL